MRGRDAVRHLLVALDSRVTTDLMVPANRFLMQPIVRIQKPGGESSAYLLAHCSFIHSPAICRGSIYPPML